MNFILFDGPERANFLPFAFTRPLAEMRIGILTFREKWEHWLKQECSVKTVAHLSTLFPATLAEKNIFINGSLLPDEKLVQTIKNLKPGEALVQGNDCLAYCSKEWEDFSEENFKVSVYPDQVILLKHLWELYRYNAEALERDYTLITANRKSAVVDVSNRIIGNRIFLEEGATATHSTFNTTSGPIYLGKNSQVMEGCMLRGGFALGEDGILKMGSKIYGAVTAGPGCKVGGEVNNSILFAHSNKSHDGFLGNSVIGEWCNLGADTNTSNLKNNYDEVRLWNYENAGFEKTGQQFCGLMMGDHSKCAINTMFNTGTVVGVSANIFGSGFPRNFIPSFSWGGAAGYKTYLYNKAMATVRLVKERRAKDLSAVEEQMLMEVYEQTKKWRRWEK